MFLSSLLRFDLDSVSNYNEHGSTLVKQLHDRNISQMHHPVILGLFSLYSLLVAMRYFDEDQISWPAHDDFKSQEWLKAGLDQTAVDVLELLPLSKDGDDPLEWEMAPSSRAISYLGEADKHKLDLTYNGDFTRPSDIRLTEAYRSGDVYIYNTKEGTMWKVDADIHNPKDYEQMPCYPAEQVLKQLIKDIYELNYIPWPDGHGMLNNKPRFNRFDHQLEQYVEFTMSETELIAYANEPNRNKDSSHYEVESKIRDQWNEMRAIKYIYQRNGWPNEFDGGTCLASLEEFAEKKLEIERRISRVNPMPMHGLIPEELPLRKELEMFLMEAAGPLAIRPSSG